MVRFEIAPVTIGLILAVVAGAWLIRELWVLGLVLLVALVFAGTFKPLIEWMTRHGLQRTVALVVLFFGLIGGTSVLIFFSVPPLLEQLAALARDAKKAVAAGQAEGEKLLLAAQSKHDEALHRFELLKRTGEESWESLKTAFETAWAEMGHALNPKA